MSASTAEVQTVEGVKVGDFFSASWGYDQTNIDFFKVVGLTAKRIKVQHWTSRTVSDLGSQIQVVPGETAKQGYWVTKDGLTTFDREAEAPVELKALRTYNWSGERRVVFKWTSYANAYLWDGKPESETAPGWGR